MQRLQKLPKTGGSRGLTLVEVVIAVAIFVIVAAISGSQLEQSMKRVSTIQAQSSSSVQMSLLINIFGKYFSTKWKGGLFECSATPSIGSESYCVVSTDCESYAGGGFAGCKSIGIIRGDPGDATTNPDRITIQTSCEVIAEGSRTQFAVQDSVCDTTCNRGEVPVVRISVAKPDGTTRTISFPGGGTGEDWQEYNASKLIGMEACLSKEAGSSVVSFSTQTFFEFDKRIRRRDRHVSFPEIAIANDAIDVLP